MVRSKMYIELDNSNSRLTSNYNIHNNLFRLVLEWHLVSKGSHQVFHTWFLTIVFRSILGVLISILWFLARIVQSLTHMLLICDKVPAIKILSNSLSYSEITMVYIHIPYF